jgi:hypothetical protein
MDIKDRISKLSPDETGLLKVNSLTQDGKKLNYEVAGTILEVQLAPYRTRGKYYV